MARIKKEGKTRERKYLMNAHKTALHPYSEVPGGVISAKCGTEVDLTDVMTYATLECYRLKSGHSAVVRNLAFP
jgi:hypothetical protein